LSFFPQRYLILLILNAVYFFVYFHRISTAVLAPYLMEAFQASGASLGAMSSAYFYPYALSQPVVGILTDRFGARKVITVCTFIEFLGALIFALAPSLLIASLGRGLIGLGAAGVFVPSLKVLIPWFGPQAFARMNAILLAVGNLGAITAATPLAWVIQQVGWRSSFFIISAILFLLTFLSAAFIRDHPAGHVATPESPRGAPSSKPGEFLETLKSPFYWVMFALFYAYGGPFSTFQGLWGYPYLIDVLGYDKLGASNLIMVIAFGVIAGGPLMAHWVDKAFAREKRQFLSACLAVQVVNWFLIAFLSPRFGSWAFGLVFFTMGMMLSGTLSVVWGIVREEAPPEKLGTALGLINPAPFLGVATFQPLTGYLMDRAGRVAGAFTPAAYQNAFTLCLAAIFVAFMISLVVLKKKNPE
jgi:predicted MFS family arabinose efflux permease